MALASGGRDLEQGIEPYAAQHGDIYRVRALDVNAPLDDFDAVVETYGNRMLAQV